MNFLSKKPGFTLLETFVALAIFTLATTIVWSFVSKSYQASTFGQEQNDAIESARRGIKTMIEEIRESGQSAEGGYLILENQSQSLKFYSDIDRDDVLEQVHYWLDGTNFKKGIIKPTADEQYLPANEMITTLSQYVRNAATPIFIYYDSDYPINQTPLSYENVSISAIRLIDIFLEINVDLTRAPNSYSLRSKVEIRTLKDNL